MGGYALTAVTCVSLLGGKDLSTRQLVSLSADTVLAQTSSIWDTFKPKAIKVGLVTDSETIRLLARDTPWRYSYSPWRFPLVVAPGIYDADGRQMIENEAINAIARHLIPEAELLMLRQRDAQRLLGFPIKTDDDMLEAARQLQMMGAECVLLRGGRLTEGRLTALLYGSSTFQFFTSYNMEGWQKHGVAGALSAAITTRLGMGDDVPTAVRNAHDFIHSQVVYAKDTDERNRRSIDLYNAFVSLVAGHYREAHDVTFYADKLCITTRYLSQVTDKVVGKPPKQIIGDYLMSEAKSYLATTRLTIQEIADKLGFSSQALFCKFFKAQEDTSPSDYRNK